MKAKHIYPSQFNDKGEWEDVNDVFCIAVEGQRQDALNNQLKDLILIADNIGCFDASKYLLGVVKEKKEPENFAFCHKCSEKIVQLDMLDPRCNTIAGCNKMTRKEWNDKSNPCPLTGAKRC